jgi:hypothetical protein
LKKNPLKTDFQSSKHKVKVFFRKKEERIRNGQLRNWSAWLVALLSPFLPTGSKL